MIKIIRKNYFLTIILSAAFLIRVIGVYPGYPQIHPDEGTSYHTAIYLLYHWFEPDRFDYPAGVPFIHALIYLSIFIPASLMNIFILNPFSLLDLLASPNTFFITNKDAIFGKIEIDAMYWSRYIAATFGTLAVGLLYLTGKRLFNREVGLFAAFFLAFNFRHVLGSHFGLPDVHSSFFAMLTLFASVLLFEKNTRQRYIFAGIAAGLTFSLKYQPFALFPFLVTHIIWTFRKRSVWYLFHPNMILGGLCIIATFLIINPYYFFNIGEAMFKNRQDYLRYQMGHFAIRPYPYFYLFHWGIGRLPFIAMIFGLLGMLIIRPLKFLLPFSFAFSFMFFMTMYSNGGIYPRNFTTPAPYLMLFAGYGMYLLYSLFRKINKSKSFLAIVILAFVVNAASIKDSLILSYEYARPWTLVPFSQWMEKSMPPDVTVRKYLLFLPYKTVAALTEKNVEQLDWSYDKLPGSLAEFQKEGTDFAIINTYIYQSTTYQWRDWQNPLMYLKNSTVPFDFIQNTFDGITLKELMQYTVFEEYKQWQAQESSNYLVFKIPKAPTQIGKKITQFQFDKKGDVWKLRSAYKYGYPPTTFRWGKNEGKGETGSLVITSGSSRVVPSRLTSPVINATPGKLYTVKGWIKNYPPTQSSVGNYDGYLRLDFYNLDSEDELEKPGISVAVSHRVPANGEWTEVSASVVAPKDAKYLTISFQVRELLLYSSFLDDVELYETDQIPEERFKEVPYIRSTIPRESIFYNGFL